MAPFARLDNVSCKLSGMVTEATWSGWTADDIAPYVRRVLDWFGPERCMFGSDWPVCLLAASYGQVLEALRYGLGNLDASEIEDVLGGTASRVYRLAR
jgi:L-fuconolactonase